MNKYSASYPRFILLFIFLFAHSCSACFSSGNSPKEHAMTTNAPESAKLRRTEAHLDNNIELKEKSEQPTAIGELEVDQAFVMEYLVEFGHLNKMSIESDGDRANGAMEMGRAIKNFQQFLGLKPSGRIDLPTLARMSWKRCANRDEAYSGSPQIWERSALFWHLVKPSIPDGFPFSLQDMKELIRQAFAAWEIVIAMDFHETERPTDAQIIFVFGEEEKDGTSEGMKKNNKMNNTRRYNKTGLGIASDNNSPLLNNQIWLNKNENWSTFQTQEEGKIDIFLVLIHEIGHSLGLKHSGDEQSVMFPMFERPVGEQLPVISNDDVERLRALYESSEPNDARSMNDGDKHTVNIPPRSPLPAPLALTKNDKNDDGGPEKCPHKISAAANVNQSMLYIFNGGQTWLFKEGRLVGGTNLISEIFPDGPEHADVAFAAGRLTVLIKSRTVFGYEFNQETGKFTRAKGFPRELHSRILFFPDAAFPIANGSIILIKDKVFATYNAETNTPHMLGNVDEFFPNLPEGFRSGFAANSDFSIYHMLTPEYAFLYDVRLSRPVGSQSIGQFLGCDLATPAGSQPSTGIGIDAVGAQIPPQPSLPNSSQTLLPSRESQRAISSARQQFPTATMVHGHGPPGFQIQNRR